MQFSFSPRHYPPTQTKRLIATHFGAQRPLSSARSPRLQQVTSTAKHSAAFERRRERRLIHEFSNRRAPLSDSERIAPVCSLHRGPPSRYGTLSYCMRKRCEGRRLSGEGKKQTKKQKHLKTFFSPKM